MLPIEEGTTDVNCVFYGNFATDYDGQGLFLGAGQHGNRLHNVAMVNLFLKQATYGTSTSQLRTLSADHILYWNITIINQRVNFTPLEGDSALRNMSIRGCCFQRLTYGDSPCTSAILDSHDVAHNHYIEGGNGWNNITPGTDWTEGDPLFTNPSADDYSPQVSSPLVGRVTSPSLPDDCGGENLGSGALRPSPSAIGAYE